MVQTKRQVRVFEALTARQYHRRFGIADGGPGFCYGTRVIVGAGGRLLVIVLAAGEQRLGVVDQRVNETLFLAVRHALHCGLGCRDGRVGLTH